MRLPPNVYNTASTTITPTIIPIAKPRTHSLPIALDADVYNAYAQALDESLPNDEFDALLFGPLVTSAMRAASTSCVQESAGRVTKRKTSFDCGELPEGPIAKRLRLQVEALAKGGSR